LRPGGADARYSAGFAKAQGHMVRPRDTDGCDISGVKTAAFM